MQGTFGLFNFFQQPNTGVTPAPNSFNKQDVINGVGHSGTISDFNWPFPYGGTAVPFVIIEGAGAGFDLKLFSDSNLGLRYAIVNTFISGSLQGNLDSTYLSSNFSGYLLPSTSDSSFYNVTFSGLTQGDIPDNIINNIIISGAVINKQPDVNTIRPIISGIILDAHPDIFLLKQSISGSINSGQADSSLCNVKFNGSFIPSNNDITNISYGYSGFSSSNVIIIVNSVNFSGENDTMNVSYGFAGFISTIGER